MNKLSPKINLGCPKCGNSLNLDDISFNFKLNGNKKDNLVKSIINNTKKSKKSSKVISLF